MAEWTPAELPGKHMMFDAEAITGFADGASIASYSIGTHHLYEGSNGLGPLYIANGAGSRPVVRFPGSRFFAAVGNEGTIRTILLVYSDTSTSAFRTPLNTDGFSNVFAGHTDDTSILSLEATTTLKWRSGAAVVRKNGSVVSNWITPRPDTMGIFAFVADSDFSELIATVGASSSASNSINGDIAFIFVGTTALSTSDLEKFEGWAAHRRGLASALPANHPYKAAPYGSEQPRKPVRHTFWL